MIENFITGFNIIMFIFLWVPNIFNFVNKNKKFKIFIGTNFLLTKIRDRFNFSLYFIKLLIAQRINNFNCKKNGNLFNIKL